MIDLRPALPPASVAIIEAATRGRYFGGARRCAHHFTLHILKHAFNAADVPLKGLVESHLLPELILCETGLDCSFVIELLLSYRILDES